LSYLSPLRGGPDVLIRHRRQGFFKAGRFLGLIQIPRVLLDCQPPSWAVSRSGPPLSSCRFGGFAFSWLGSSVSAVACLSQLRLVVAVGRLACASSQ